MMQMQRPHLISLHDFPLVSAPQLHFCHLYKKPAPKKWGKPRVETSSIMCFSGQYTYALFWSWQHHLAIKAILDSPSGATWDYINLHNNTKIFIFSELTIYHLVMNQYLLINHSNIKSTCLICVCALCAAIWNGHGLHKTFELVL